MRSAIGLGAGLPFARRFGGTPFIPLPEAELDLDFLTGTYSESVTFSRASNATMVDSLGRIVWAPHNLAPAPTAINSTRENNPPGELNPFGVEEGVVRVTATGFDPSFGNFTQTSSVFIGQKASYTISCWVKCEGASVGKLCRFFMYRDGVADVQNSEFFYGTATWVRRSATYTFTGAPTTNVTFRLDCPDAATAGDSTLIYGWQVERADVSTPKDYIDNGGVAYYAPRLDRDPVTLAARGLRVEESRSNLVGISDGTGASNGTNTAAPTAMLGWSGARRFTGAAGSATKIALPGITNTPAGSITHSLSAYVRYVDNQYIQLSTSANMGTVEVYANIDLLAGAITQVGTDVISSGISATSEAGVFYVWLTFVTNAVPTGGSCTILYLIASATDTRGLSNTLETSFDFFGLQCEAGAFPTSLIPTTGTAVTRAADAPDAAIVGAASYTLMIDFEPGNLATSSKTAASLFGDFSNYTRIIQTATIAAQSGIGGVLLTGSAGASTLIPTKVAASISPSQMLTARDGALTDTDAGAPFDASAITTLNIGRLGPGSTPLNGWVRKVKYYQTALTAAQLEALTA